MADRLTIIATIVALMASQAPANESANLASASDLDRVVESFRSEGPEAALSQFQTLRAAFAESGQTALEARATRYVGESHWLTGEFDLARESLNRALALARSTNDREGEASALNVLGLVEWDSGNFSIARAHFAVVRSIAAAIGDLELEGMALNNDSMVLDELGEYNDALVGYKQALKRYREVGFERGIGDTLGNTAGVYLLLGQYSKALEGYHQALAVSERLASKPAMTIDHGNIGLVHFALGNDEAAASHFDHALRLAAETGLAQESAYWQRAKGNLLVRAGRYDEGIALHRAGLLSLEQIEARGLLVDALRDIGQVHLELGDAGSAEQRFQEAILLARSIGAEQAVTATLISLGDLHAETNRLDEAAALYGRARDRAEEGNEASMVLEAMLKQARSLRKLGQTEQARVVAREALSSAREAGAVRAVVQALLEQCEVSIDAHLLQPAIEDCTRAERELATAIDPELRWQIHYARGRAHHAAGQLEAAIGELEAAVGIIESVRDRLRADRFRAGYIEDKIEVYITLLRVLLATGRTETGFAVAERLRAQTRMLQLVGASTFKSVQDADKFEMEMRARISHLQGALIHEQAQPQASRRQAAVDSFSTALLEAEREYQAFLDDRTNAAPSGLPAATRTPTEIQRLLKSSDLLLEFVVANDALITFALRGDEIVAVTEPVTREQLVAGITLVRELVQRPDRDLWRRPAERLAEVLLRPLVGRGLLNDVDQLYVVPHGALHYLPFSILPMGGDELLVDRFTLTYLPSASGLVSRIGHGERQQSLLAMTPERARLKWAAEEVRLVEQNFAGASLTLTGKRATESLFKASAERFDVLHLATHGYFNRLNPLLSGLELEADATENGLLEVHEILKLPLNASLVTLSACQTAMGSGHFREFPAGDEFVGLARAFLIAGSDAVLASLWPVDDQSTVRLMEDFYAHRSREGGREGLALALAQRGLRNSDTYSHPFFWAPFVTIGAQVAEPGRLAAH